MSTVDDLRKQIISLEPSEAEELAQWLWDFVGPHQGPQSQGTNWPSGIDATPDVCGGDPRIIRTRIPVWVLEQFRRQGLSEAEILHSYPTLRAEDLVHAWAYVALHRDEIEQQIRANEEA